MDRMDLADRACLDRACAWVERQRPAFRVERKRESIAAAVKAVAELAHAADFLLRSPAARHHAAAQAWLDQAWAELEQGELLRELIAANPRLIPFATALLPFHLRGYRNPTLVSTIAAQARCVRMGPLNWTLLVPVLRLLDLDPTPEMCAQADSLSVLQSQPHAQAMPADAVYVLTHECMYACGLGRYPLRGTESQAAYLRHVLPELVERFVDMKDADIVAELLLACHAVAIQPTARAEQILITAQIADGCVMTVDASQLPATILPRFSHPRLGRHYHTTLVAIMAWAARCAPGLPRDPMRLMQEQTT